MNSLERHNGANILLVDDQPANLDALESILDSLGCRLIRAQTANEALLALLTTDFAAIVLDIKMPDVNGIELARMIKERKRTQHIPILFLTAHMADEKDVLSGYGVGAVDYLSKPVNPQILKSKLGVFVQLFHQTRALAAANRALEAEVAERQRAQEGLRQANEELEERVRERTADLVWANDCLRESEERLRLALYAGAMGLWSVDLGNGVESFDRAGCTLLGLDPEHRIPGRTGESQRGEFATGTFHRAVHPDDLPAVLSAAEALKGGNTNTIEFRVVLPGRQERWLCSMGKAQVGKGGEPLRLVGILYDITQRKRAEAALRESEEYFREVIQGVPHAVWISLPDGTVDFVNRRWLDYTGQTLEEMTSSRGAWLAAFHPEDRERARNACSEGMASGEGFSVEARIRRSSDGSYRWHLSRCVPLRGAGGQLVKFLMTCTDIAEQKRAEEALREADDRKNVFIATLAHELRNPLAPIRNALQVLRLAADNRTAREQAQAMMERQLNQLVRLVDDLLDVSRIASGRIELRRERVDLSAIVHSAVETSQPVLKAAEHELSVVLPPEPILLDADLTRLAQVISNLLNNAAKYSERAGHVTLLAEREGSHVAVKIRDTGIGIAEGMLSRIFDLFTQADRRLERTQGGLGIGLAIARRLVEMHGGTIAAHSEGLGQGSEFVIRLPVASLGPATPRAAGDCRERRPRASQLRILLADDNPDAADSLARLLQLEGNEVRIARDGEEALKAAESFRPEVVILDIGMPKLNGYDVALRLREQSWGQALLLIALTGWGQVEDRRRSSAAGFDHHLVKPVDPAALVKLLLGAKDGTCRPSVSRP
jgi:two-component system CheB/CheR fusion protein